MKTIHVLAAICLLAIGFYAESANATVTSYTLRSYLPGSTTVIQMSVIDSGNGSVRCTTQSVTPSSDSGHIFVFSPASYNSDGFTVANNGHTHWQVPFGNDTIPTTIAGGSGGGSITCYCRSVTGDHDKPHDGNCAVWVVSYWPDVVYTCLGSCYGCETRGTRLDNASAINIGTLFIEATKLYYNGTLYQ